MNAPSEDIKDMLAAESNLALTAGSNLFVGREPPARHEARDCVTIYDTPGTGPQLTTEADERYERPSVQIRVRNRSYITGWTLIHDIMESLHGRAHETWNGTLYTVIQAVSNPALLNYDDDGNVRFVLNLNMQRR